MPAATADPFVPSSLLDAATATPNATFKVIVQGTPRATSAGVATDVRGQEHSHPGREHGIRRSFRSVTGVSAELTGRQILALSHARNLQAITPDVPLVANVEDPPTNVVPPSVLGVAQDGQTLTALNGQWTGGHQPYSGFAYQWLRCDAAGAACVEIVGATTDTYVASAADVDATIAVAVTATDGDELSATAVSAATSAVAAAPAAPILPPANLGAPIVSGLAREGETLSAAEGTWSGLVPISYAFQWQRCAADCVDIDGATAATYDATSADVGLALRVVVTAEDASGSASAASAQTAAVTAAAADTPQVVPPANLGAPIVSGLAREGETLNAVEGSWAGTPPLAFAFQWQRCAADCVDIEGATDATYQPSADDVGSALRVVVTAQDAVGSASAESAQTATVTAALLASVSPPSIAVSGQTLAAESGDWTGGAQPLAFSYLWQRCASTCVDVGDTETYTTTADDAGASLVVTVTATDANGATATASSQPMAIAAPAPPVSVEPPTIQSGFSYQASPGHWNGDSLDFAYQWLRCGSTGDDCGPIEDATSESYDPVAADIGETLRVRVTATNAAGTAHALSGATDRVPPPTASGFWSWQLWPYAVHADELWSHEAAPAIAVVDSGVDATLPGLTDAVQQQVTITTLPQRDVADGYGHGTFVAAVAAGRAPGEAGAAPTAPIVSLDVMNDDGMAMTSDVIAAADWIYTHASQDGIRVANFSLLGASPSSFQFDPLDRALEKLWLSGIVVVTAAGNYAVDGAPGDVAYAPANDPFAITVGAADTAGTTEPADDFAAPWSAYGHTFDGFAKPELGAPGRYMVEPVPTDSTLYTTRPDRIVAPGELQLSGTSFAAPVVSGLAAQLLALHPDWTPDQVKGALMLTAVQPGAAAPTSLGVGEVDGAAAAALENPPNPNEALDAFVGPDPAGGPTPVFDVASWGTTVQANASWGTASWGTASWGTASWGTASWGTAYWSSASWGTASWGTASWGTSAGPAENAAADFLPAGAYWMRWPAG